MPYEAVVGLEVHAELQTNSKMFCSCPVVDPTQVEPNIAVCPVCAGMPGVLPVVNQKAVELAMRVGLALECNIVHTSLFARKNYFYPDLPKGYQISQYEFPLAENGRMIIDTQNGEKLIRIRRAHLEEDTGKLTHNGSGENAYSLVDLNRAGIPLLEIVTEPDMHTLEEIRTYATGLRSLLRYLGVNSGDMEKGVIRFEANVSIREEGSQELGTRVEIKNLNSFRAMERAVAYEIDRQSVLLDAGGKVDQETLGWNEAEGKTYTQRSKEEAHDYRYFPEPDLPPLVVEQEWVDRVKAGLPELPRAKILRFKKQYNLSTVDANQLVSERVVADYFEQVVAEGASPRLAANWILGELFGWMNQSGEAFESLKVTPPALASLVKYLEQGKINQQTAKTILSEMLSSGKAAGTIITEQGLEQVSDSQYIADIVRKTIAENPNELQSYLAGKETLANWFFGQVMRSASGKANPQVVREELERQLRSLK
ncbi:MAG: Asp-tRNA(Asn)/Glu-tRNA(Gln) amidotransferase subunit GatB [Anaerolineaceae bacterium]|nr:Asp-tRNA(Asn)/Glu-tRNA(Gln) amidotransferase subunit GatB [Anaerolineaceae bacterium]